MKALRYVAFVFIVSCTSSTATQESTSDSTVLADSVTPEEPSAYNEPTSQTSGLDSAWLREFVKRPLGEDPYESLKIALEGKNIVFNDSVTGGSVVIAFDKTKIDLLIAEAYGTLICSADIYSQLIPLEKGVVIGMNREDFLRTSGIPESLLQNEGTDGKQFFKFDFDYGDNSSNHATFWLDQKSFIRLELLLTPCAIYD